MTLRSALGAGSKLCQRYSIQRSMGQGRFWLSYLGRDEAHEVDVVIKEYLPAGVAQRLPSGDVGPASPVQEDVFDWGRARFVEEATLLRNLNVPGIASVTDVFFESGTAYYVREHVPGISLIGWVDRLGRRLQQSELDMIAGRLTDALAILHQAGRLHHDITPEHIILRHETREPVFVDSGAARTAFAVHTRQLHTYVRPGYSPPEQHLFEERAQGPWTDVFMLAATLYRAAMLRGPDDVIARNIRDDMPKAAIAAQKIYRPGFLNAIDAAMSLTVADRPGAATALAAQLLAMPSAQHIRPDNPSGPKSAPKTRSAEIHPAASYGMTLTNLPPILLAGLGVVVVAAAGIALRLTISSPPIAEWPQPHPKTSPSAVIIENPRPPAIATPPSAGPAIDDITDRDALLDIARRFPERRLSVEQRLAALGFVQIATPAGARWLIPGAGEPFRDCPTCPEMVVLPTGSYLMGSPQSEEGRGADEDDKPGPDGQQVLVNIRKPIAIGRYEITRGEFSEFIAATSHDMGTGCHTRVGQWHLAPELSWRAAGYAQDDRHPVACVSWNDAQAYATWLSAKTGETYRLPTEAEWEYAARGATSPVPQPRFSFGSEERELCTYANGADFAARIENPDWQVAPCNDGFAGTAPVGRYRKNAFGTFDMLGNLWEWTEDCWFESLARDASITRGCEAKSPRSLRGGSWSDPPRMLRPAARIASDPDVRDQIAGFRLVREIRR